jgi:hypothetical protein
MRLVSCLFALLSVVVLVVGQESCSSGMVGFTALTPDQLREEIRKTIKDNLDDILDGFTQRATEDYRALESSVEGVNESIAVLQREVIREMTALEGVISKRLEEAVVNLTLAFREELLRVTTSPTPPTTSPTPPTTSPTPPTTSPTPPTSSPSLPNTQPPPPPGLSPHIPAESCQHVQEALSGRAPTGSYWVTDPNTGRAVSVYCDMTRVCGNLTGGWMRVTNIDMRESAQQCPGSFVELVRDTEPNRLCTPSSSGEGCFSHTFPVTASYRHVCGRVIAYQDSTPNAFFGFHVRPSTTINDTYVDGISLTYGTPRTHVWTFAAALDETTGHFSGCRCTNTNVDLTANIPPFVGNDYFCETGSREDVNFVFYAADPLWDGQGCGRNSTCCSFNNPPWFFRSLESATSDGLEMRVCRDSGSDNEDTPFEVVELYVR